MNPDTRHKAIIAIAFLIAVGSYLENGQSAQVGFVAGFSSFALLYAGYYALHVVRWVAFRGENGTGLQILPRIGNFIGWVFRSILYAIKSVIRAMSAMLLWLFHVAGFMVRAIHKAIERRKWERERPEREKRAAEEAEAQQLRAEEARRKKEIADAEDHKRRVAREAEIAAARVKAEEAAHLQMQKEANRLAREHEEQMLAIERERLTIAEKRGKRHESIMNNLADLVAKSKE